MKKAGLPLIAGALFILGITIDRFAPVPEGPTICDDVCEAMYYIEAGRNVPEFIYFPIYMSRFDLEVVEIVDRYQSQLPKNICLGKKAVLIMDSTTGYQWLTNGYGTRYRVR